MKPLLYSTLAKEDIQAQRDYYASIHEPLANRFVASVEAAALALQAHPEAMAVLDKQVRRWPVRGFEHGIMYSVNTDFIAVLAVFHARQDPQHLTARLKTR